MQWSEERLLELGRRYQPAAVLVAAAELGLFDALSQGTRPASALARGLDCDLRSLTILLDALVAIQLLVKHDDQYSLVAGTEALLPADGTRTVVPMLQHQANCLRRWAQLASVVKSGRPAERVSSIRGEARDLESFIGAMDTVSMPVAETVIRSIEPMQFEHLLDIGGGPGTWTAAFLRACPNATATLFDLPAVLPLARRRLKAAGLIERVQLVAGDYLTDALPGGSDLAWASAIVHQNSREENQRLFVRVCEALRPGGRIAIRDVLVDPTRTRPLAGALFAVNMLVATPGGATFTLGELQEDLERAGFVNPVRVREDDAMNSVVVAMKP